VAYFFVLPAFFLWLIIAGALVVATKRISRIHSAYSIVWRISLWGTLGFIAANALFIVLLISGFSALDVSSASPSFIHNTLQFLFGLIAIGGPVIASFLGWLVGVMVGAVLSLYYHVRAAQH
jgi:hypothetical protein